MKNIDLVKIGTIDQGVIFSGATCDRYRDCKVHGIVITARCDIENDKFPILNYLPVVKYDDWLLCDGFDIARDRIQKNCRDKLDSLFKNNDLPISLFEIYNPIEIAESYISSDEIKNSDKIIAALNDYDKSLSLTKNCPKDISYAYENNSTVCRKITQELCKQALSGHYFLESIGPENSDGYVILLREIRHLPYEIAVKLRNGIEYASTSDETVDRFLSIGKGDLAMPVSILKSPDLEHLLQTVWYLFARIGLPNVPDELLTGMLNRHPSSRGAE